MTEDNAMEKKKISIILIVVSAIIIGIFATLTIKNTDIYKINKCLKVAYKDLNAGNFDDSVAAFTSALDIDFNSKDAYIGLAKSYIGKGDYEGSTKIIETAKAVLGDDFTAADEQLIHDALASSHEHKFEKATCLQPEVCSICNEIRGEALGHDFVDADCVNPKTCSRCGETEGEPLGHDFEEATYWSAKTCKICNATEGNPLPGAFEQHGLSYIDNLDTIAKGNLKDHDIPFDIKMLDYRCFDGDESHEAKDGYVWQEITMDIVFYLISDAWYYNFKYGEEDFYDPALADDTSEAIGGNLRKYTVNYMGKTYEDCLRNLDFLLDYYHMYEKDDTIPYSTHHIQIQHSFRVPKGYDGNIVDFCNNANHWAPGTYIYDNAEGYTFFRLPAAN